VGRSDLSGVSARSLRAVWTLGDRRWGEELPTAVAPLPVAPLGGGGPAAADSVIVVGGRLPDDATGWRDLVGAAPWVHFVPTGIDRYPLDWLQGRTVSCGRGVHAVPIAEYTVGAILAAEKRFAEPWAVSSRQNVWQHPLGRLEGKTVGLVGVGSIGRAVAQRLQGFGVRILAARRTEAASEIPGVEVTSLPEVLRSADHLVLAVPLTADTGHLLDAHAFSQVKRGVHLINVARGGLVDQTALVDAIDAGIVARASLDVTDPEPLPADHPLRHRPQVFITPHVSWSGSGTGDPTVDRLVANLRHWEQAEPLEGLVDVDAGY
jgi:phosphoglycerate dehydrogenase-like enzyme